MNERMADTYESARRICNEMLIDHDNYVMYIGHLMATNAIPLWFMYRNINIVKNNLTITKTYEDDDFKIVFDNTIGVVTWSHRQYIADDFMPRSDKWTETMTDSMESFMFKFKTLYKHKRVEIEKEFFELIKQGRVKDIF